MPELPDITAYLTALEPLVLDQPLQRVRVVSPFLLRSLQPPLSAVDGRPVRALRRVGKRIAIGLQDDFWLVIHLMIAGRFCIAKPQPDYKLAGRHNLAAFDFTNGTHLLTEAGSKRRASFHVVAGEVGLQALDPGGFEVFSANLITEFQQVLTITNHTLKRALTDPRLLSGIGNAYSDEILHAAQLSPIAQTHKLRNQTNGSAFFEATRGTLKHWMDKLSAEARRAFPEKVTAFRPDMAVHGRYGEDCPRCGQKVLRIRYADNETNYCARCQTGGKVLADRGLSRLLGADWPRTLEELENLQRRR